MNQHPHEFASEAAHIAEVVDMKMNVLAAQIRKLGELRDEGLLTEEEFSAAKKQLLSEL